MSLRTLVVFVFAALVAKGYAGSVCTDDFYGILEGTPHALPEHYLRPTLVDWGITIPPICGGQYIAGMEARVCTFLPTPAIRIIGWDTALVHSNARLPIYTSVNVTVYCTSRLEESKTQTVMTTKPATTPATTTSTSTTTSATTSTSTSTSTTTKTEAPLEVIPLAASEKTTTTEDPDVMWKSAEEDEPIETLRERPLLNRRSWINRQFRSLNNCNCYLRN